MAVFNDGVRAGLCVDRRAGLFNLLQVTLPREARGGLPVRKGLRFHGVFERTDGVSVHMGAVEQPQVAALGRGLPELGGEVGNGLGGVSRHK